ncbi:hypothetical protein CCACVL1_03301, partial [Corchorus capsularis]
FAAPLLWENLYGALLRFGKPYSSSAQPFPYPFFEIEY